MHRLLTTAAIALALTGSAGVAAAQPGPVAGALGVLSPTTDRWRDYATPGDRSRIENLDQTWAQQLRVLRDRDPSGFRPYAALFDPAAATRMIVPAPGAYRCRSLQTTAEGDFYPYGWFRCRMALSPGGTLTLTKLTGSQRQAGVLFPGDPAAPSGGRRQVFLGTLALSSQETGWPRYGFNAERNVAGVVERLGPNRYRLVTPGYNGRGLDVLELQRTGN